MLAWNKPVSGKVFSWRQICGPTLPIFFGAKNTAEIFALEHQASRGYSDLFRERNHGRFEGKTADEFNEELQRFTRISTNAAWWQPSNLFSFYEGYETDDQVLLADWSQFWQIAVAYPGKMWRWFSHSGSLRVLMRRFGYTSFSPAYKGQSPQHCLHCLGIRWDRIHSDWDEGAELGEDE